MPTGLPVRRSSSSFSEDMSVLLWMIAAALLVAVIFALALVSHGHPGFGEDFALPCVSMGDSLPQAAGLATL